jgi:hypothetical protein
MKFQVIETFKLKTSKEEIELQPGQIVTLPDAVAITLIEKGRVTPIESLSVPSWLDKLSHSEREMFEERSAVMEHDGGLPRELAEIEAVKRIIHERIVPGKCDRCERVNGCMLTKKHRELCEVVKANMKGGQDV